MKKVSKIEISESDYNAVIASLKAAAAMKTDGMREAFLNQALSILTKEDHED